MTGTRIGRHLIVPAALIISVLPLGSTQAHVVADDSTVTRDYNNGRFHGEVKGTPPRCKHRRQINLFKVKEGNDDLVARDSTDGDGFWSIERPRANGTFYAVVTRDVEGRYGHSHICRRDQSNRITVN